MRIRNILLLFLIGGLVALVSCNDDDAKVEEVKDEDDQEQEQSSHRSGYQGD